MSDPDPQAVRSARDADAAAVDRDRTGHSSGVDKLETGIAGFDHVTQGGLPRRRATVVAGQAGSAKTVFAAQFLAEGVRRGQPAVFVTLEEPAQDVRTNLQTLGWDISGWEERGLWRFVDAAPVIGSDGAVVPYSFGSLAALIGKAVDETGAERVSIDSLNSVVAIEADSATARQRLRGLVADLRSAGLTIVMTVETATDPAASLSRYGIEEFVADNVVLLRNAREGKGRRRSLEVLKMRGAAHHKGDYAFTIVPGSGIVVLPLATSAMTPGRSTERISTGIGDLDQMCGGGWLRDSITLLGGPSGSGKTLLGLEFLASAALTGERALLLGYEEPIEQIARNAVGLGRQLTQLRQDGVLLANALYPEEASLDEHLVEIKQVIDEFRPTRMVIDSLTALERAGTPDTYREFVVSLTSYAKSRNVTTLLITSMSGPLSGRAISDGQISALSDTVVALRYVEHPGSITRAISVVKMRGSRHDNAVRGFEINDDGLVIGEPVDVVAGAVSAAQPPLGLSQPV